MSPAETHEITDLLRAWAKGDEMALEHLIPLVDGPLRRAAKHYLHHRFRDATLETGSLVNETYLRLIAARRLTYEDRGHFFALSAHVMRGILVDHARSRRSAKRGGGVNSATLDTNAAGLADQTADLLAIDDALDALSKLDGRKARVVELRFFGGFSAEETAEALDVSPETVRRDWRLAKVWLLRELSRR
jgi:RNA polymerase sigma-70 factor (ECF subfamily)